MVFVNWRTNFIKGKLSNIEIAYLAGLIDGEGTISLRTHKYKITPFIQISTSDVKLIDYLASKINLNWKIIRQPISSSELQKKTCYQIGKVGFNIIEFLKKIEPHLIVKKELAQLVIKYITLRMNRKKYHQPLSQQEIDIFWKVKEINLSLKELEKYKDMIRKKSAGFLPYAKLI